jgi:hypothetical protein
VIGQRTRHEVAEVFGGHVSVVEAVGEQPPRAGRAVCGRLRLDGCTRRVSR